MRPEEWSDELSCGMQAEIWSVILASLVDLGPQALDVTQKEKEVVVVSGQETTALKEDVPEEMVDYEGTLISATAAQRRRYAYAVACMRTLLSLDCHLFLTLLPP